MSDPNQGPASHLAPPESSEAIRLTSRPETAFVEGFVTKGPGLVYMELQDRLYVRTFSAISGQGSSVTVRGRLMRIDGQIVVFEFPYLNGAGVITPQIFDLAEGYLLDVSVQNNAGTPHAQVYVQVGLLRGNANSYALGTTLIAGNLTGTECLGWPFSRLETSTDGQGTIAEYTPSNPAAGADFSFTTDAASRCRVQLVGFLLTTSGTAATREVTLIVDDGTTIMGQFPASATQTASLAVQYTGSAAPYAPNTNAGVALVPLPPSLVLRGNFRIRSSTANLQSGDQYSAIRLLLEAWVDAQ